MRRVDRCKNTGVVCVGGWHLAQGGHTRNLRRRIEAVEASERLHVLEQPRVVRTVHAVRVEIRLAVAHKAAHTCASTGVAAASVCTESDSRVGPIHVDEAGKHWRRDGSRRGGGKAGRSGRRAPILCGCAQER